MNGFQRTALVVLCILAVMVCFPDYPLGAGWMFAGIVLAAWVGVIMVLAVLLGVFGLDRFDFINRVVTLALLIGILYSLLWYFPQDNKPAPIMQLQAGQYPSSQTVMQGLKQLTFNFDFHRRNIHNRNNFINQKGLPPAEEKPAPKPAPKPAWDELEIEVEE